MSKKTKALSGLDVDFIEIFLDTLAEQAKILRTMVYRKPKLTSLPARVRMVP